MKLILKGVHLQLTEAMKTHVAAHLLAPIERFYDDEAAEMDVMLVDNNGPKGGLDKECRVTVFMPGSSQLHITEVSDDVYKSIDLARDRLERIAKRELERKREVSGHPVEKPAAALGTAIYEADLGESP